MMSTSTYGYSNTLNPNNTRRMFDNYTWLSSSPVLNIMNGGGFGAAGEIGDQPVTNNSKTIAATQLDATKILFVSPGEGGKPDAMTKVQNSAKTEWKLTLKDDLQAIMVSNIDRIGEKEVAFDYDVTGNGNSISAMVIDESGENICFYGSVADLTKGKTGTATIELPDNFEENKYSLKVFSEIRNGDKKTDYASEMKPITVPKATKISGQYTFKKADGQESSESIEYVLGSIFTAYDGQVKTYTDSSGQMYVFDKWTYDPIDAIVDGRIKKSFHATASYKKFKATDVMLWDETVKQYLNPPTYSSDQAWLGNKLYWAGSKWRILNTSENTYGATNGVLIQGEESFGENVFNNWGSGTAYTGSVLETTIDGYATANLSTQEKNATLLSTKTETDYTVGTKAYRDDLTNRLRFAPTARMMSTTTYGYPKDTIANSTRKFDNITGHVWLSSAHTTDVNFNGYVTNQGEADFIFGFMPCSTIVASQLDANKILFVSPAKDGKTETMSKVKESTTTDWKLTLKDRNQTVDIKNVHRTSETKATFEYSATGMADSLSAIITDQDGKNISYYGVIADISTNKTGTASVTLPDDFDASNYKLKVFSEIRSGDDKTDYASEWKEVPVKLLGKYKYKTVDGQDKSIELEYQKGTQFDCYSAQPKAYTDHDGQSYRFIEWRYDSTDAIVNGKIEKGFSATAYYVKTWKVKFQTWDGMAWPENPWKDSDLVIDDGAGLTSSQLPTAPKRMFYAFIGWDQDITTITANTIIKPVYVFQPISIHTSKETMKIESKQAKAVFGDLDNSSIDEKLSEIYKPELYSGSEKYMDQSGLSIHLKNTDDYLKLQSGELGEYCVEIEYINPKDASYTAYQEVSLIIIETTEPILDDKSKENIDTGDTNSIVFLLASFCIATTLLIIQGKKKINKSKRF